MSVSQRSETDVSRQKQVVMLVLCALAAVMVCLVTIPIAFKCALALIVTGGVGLVFRIWPATMCRTIIFSGQMAFGAWLFFSGIQKGAVFVAVVGLLYFAFWTWILTLHAKS
jgi:hypothetical protein